MTHTPGSWGVLRGKESVIVYIPFRGSEDELSSFISLHNGAPGMLAALEEVMGELDVECRPCPLCGRDLTIGHKHNCIWHVVESAIRKARGEDA